MFSQASLIVDSNFSKNLIEAATEIVGGITDDIIAHLNDIELCCFFIRYCENKDLLHLARSRLSEETLTGIEMRLTGCDKK
jgi:hypothetical protein